jgi:hypothetical protein
MRCPCSADKEHEKVAFCCWCSAELIVRLCTGIARTLFGDHERYQQTYFSTYKGYYVTGDGARRYGSSPFQAVFIQRPITPLKIVRALHEQSCCCPRISIGRKTRTEK